MKITDKTKVIEYINSLKNHQGYVQFSHRPIDKQKDIFLDSDIKIKDEDGFIYEAHFCNETQSIQIRQLNDGWIVAKTDISNIPQSDIQNYISDIQDFNYKIKMAQIWEEEIDPLCENMKVKKLKKVVFAGFKND